MRKPKAPAGFVPVDSEEAKGIGEFDYVNYAYTSNGRWLIANNRMGLLRQRHDRAEHNYHVQLPPPVEWEEVWGWGIAPDAYCLYWNGRKVGEIENYNDNDVFIVTPDHIRTIVRALNEMEGRDG